MAEVKQPDFELTASEKDLLAGITFNPDALREREADIRNGNAVNALMRLLIARKAIPAQRVKYFVDPAYHIGGRGKSRKQVFERNGCAGEDIFRHPHFLESFWYFLHGSSLPEAVSEEFRDALRHHREISSRNIASLAKSARNIARAYRLEAQEAGDEFYKLALDCGLKHGYAEDIRTAVRKMR
jgi:hypothetical protein